MFVNITAKIRDYGAMEIPLRVVKFLYMTQKQWRTQEFFSRGGFNKFS